MGKSDKIKKKQEMRPYPLDQQITDSQFAKTSTRVKVRKCREVEDKFVDDKATKKILLQARQQQEDLEEETGLKGLSKRLESSSLQGGHLSHEEEEDEIAEVEGFDFMEEIEISEEDEKALASFMPKDACARATLADIIKEKLTEKQTEIHTIFSDAGSSMRPEDLKHITALYEKVGVLLSRYRSGKLPKAFKAIPKFQNWEQILYITQPDKWSAAAMYQATRIFASNLKDQMAQRFYNLILLPRLRDDIAECKKLNFHLYEALKKALFKPAAFFRGIILPLCESGTCTLREATIFGSVLAKLSVPMLHSSAALLLIAGMGYSGANSIFMRVLLEKKYALPYRVIDGLVAHFLRFLDDDRKLPLFWHQCLLTFVQIYKNDLSVEQSRELLRLLTRHAHPHVAQEIRRELQGAACRSTEVAME